MTTPNAELIERARRSLADDNCDKADFADLIIDLCDALEKSDARAIQVESELQSLARRTKIRIPTDTMEQECTSHYRRGYEAGQVAIKDVLRGLLAIHDSVTQGQEQELRAQWIPQARVLVEGKRSTP